MITPDLDQKEVTVFGWVEDIRDLGGLAFLSLRDREGTVQITVPKKRASGDVREKVGRLGRQFSIGVRGRCRLERKLLVASRFFQRRLKSLVWLVILFRWILLEEFQRI